MAKKHKSNGSLVQLADREIYALIRYLHPDPRTTNEEQDDAAANDSDRKALQELVTLFNNLRLWSDGLVEAQRDLRLAELSMSPDALNDDTLFQKIAGCEAFLAQMLTSRRLAQDPLCE